MRDFSRWRSTIDELAEAATATDRVLVF